MAEPTAHLEPDAAAESEGVGSRGTAVSEESASVSTAEEINQLDASLCEMTSLLLSDGDDEFDVEGEFAEPADQGSEIAADGDRSEDGQSPDPAAQVEQVQAAVTAALEEVAEDLDGQAGEAAASGQAGADVAPEGATARTDEAEATDTAPEPGADLDAALAAVAEDLDPAPAESAVVPEPDPQSNAGAQSEAEPPQAVAEEDPAPEPADAAEAVAPEPEAADTAPSEPATDPATPEPATASPSAAAVQPAAAPASAASDAPAPSKIPPVLVRVAVAAAPLAALLDRGLGAVTVRLESQPKIVRHSLAWLAVWTAFNAGAAWVYLVFFRASGPEADPNAMTRLSGVEPAPLVEQGEPD